MKVLHVYKTYYPDTVGGIEKTIFQISEEIEKQGIESVVLSLSEHPHKGGYAVAHHRAYQAKQDIFLFSTGLSLSFFSLYRRLAKQADIIHYHFPWPWMDLAALTIGRKKPCICTYHSDIVRQKTLLEFYRPLMRLFLGRQDCIVATSANYLYSSHVLRLYRDKVRIIPIGIDDYPFDSLPAAKVDQWRRALPRKFFLFIGVLRYYKGLHILIDALAGWDVPTVIIGAGPIERELKAQARSRGLKNLIFLGGVSDIDKMTVLSLSYGVLFPSHLRSEAFGISLLEGAMAGKPLISSEIGTGTSYINIDNDTGLIVKPGDPQSLHSAMEKIWNDERLAAEMGRRGRARFNELFTAGKMGNSYAQLYKDVLSRYTHDKECDR